MTGEASGPCIFCEIIAGRAPAKFLADGISSVMIEPLGPVVSGHLLVMPKTHVKDAYEEPYVTAKTMNDAASWARIFADRDPRYISANLITSIGRPATQSVFHLHIHVVPRAVNDGLALPWYSGRTERSQGGEAMTCWLQPPDAANGDIEGAEYCPDGHVLAVERPLESGRYPMTVWLNDEQDKDLRRLRGES